MGLLELVIAVVVLLVGGRTRLDGADCRDHDGPEMAWLAGIIL